MLIHLLSSGRTVLVNRRTITSGAIVLAAVILLAAAGTQALETYRSQEVLSTPWGRGSGQLGLLEQAEGVGPQSLCVDAAGNIYILDLVNRRVQVFSSGGEFIRQTACGILAHDLLLGPSGEMYLLAPYHGLVEKYDAEGNLLTSWLISPDIWLIDGLRVLGDRIVLRTAQQTEYTVAEKGQVLEPKQQLGAVRTGLSGRTSGRRYATRWVDAHLGLLQILDDGGQPVRDIQVTTAEELGSLVFIGEDAAGNVYLRAELLGVPKVDRLRIFKYGPGDDLLAEFTMPASDFTFIYRNLYLSPQGHLYQLLTGPDGVRVLRWTAAGEAEEGQR
jgi:hypothetical protein